ncbi:MAG TPA: HAD family hydrolase [Dissulfurispiraceae bacterium]
MNKAIFFDLYGTLIDIRTEESDPWVHEVLSRYLAYCSVDITPEELKKAYFEEVRLSLKNSAEEYPEVDIFKVFNAIMHRYGRRKYPRGTVVGISMLFRSLARKQFGPFPGIYDALAMLAERRYKTAIISDAQWTFTEPEIAMLGLDRFFKVRLLSSVFGFKKPDVRLFRTAMERLGVKPEESVYIGDNPAKDLVGSKRAGMKFVLFRSECRAYDGFQPDGCFSSYSELDLILRGME